MTNMARTIERGQYTEVTEGELLTVRVFLHDFETYPLTRCP
jgi:hypothetical protein